MGHDLDHIARLVLRGWRQGLGALETTLLIFGVAGLPLAVLVGVSYALWAGLCVAFIAFAPAPVVKDRMGLMQNGAG